MKKTYHLALLMIFLIISLPFCFSTELNLTHDANGNLVSGDGFYREYNSLNQLVKVYNGSNSSGVLLQELVPDLVEERTVMKIFYYANGSVRETKYYPFREFVRIVNESGTYDFTYLEHEGQKVAQILPDGTTEYIHSDPVSSTMAVTNSSGDVIETTQFSPYGEILSGGERTLYDYEDKEHDSITNQYDFNFRQNKPEWAGMFTQPDTLLPNVFDPQSLNRFSFERHNPYRYKDNNGHQFVEGLVIIGLAIIFGYLTALEIENMEKHPDEYSDMDILLVWADIATTVLGAGKVITGFTEWAFHTGTLGYFNILRQGSGYVNPEDNACMDPNRPTLFQTLAFQEIARKNGALYITKTGEALSPLSGYTIWNGHYVSDEWIKLLKIVAKNDNTTPSQDTTGNPTQNENNQPAEDGGGGNGEGGGCAYKCGSEYNPPRIW